MPASDSLLAIAILIISLIIVMKILLSTVVNKIGIKVTMLVA